MPSNLLPTFVASKTIADTTTGGDTLIFDVPNDFPISRFQLRAKGNIVVGTAAADGVEFGGIANLFDNIRIQAKGGIRMDLSGRSLRLINKILNQDSLNQTDPGITVATQAYAISLFRQFQLPRMFVGLGDKGILPVPNIRDIQIICTIANPNKILEPAATTTLTYSGGSVRLSVEKIPLAPADPTFYVNEVLSDMVVDTSILTSAGVDKEIRLNTGGRYRFIGLIVEAEDANGTFLPKDNVVNNIRILTNQSELFRMGWLDLQDDNRENYFLTAAPSGTAVLDWTRFSSPDELLDVREEVIGGSDLKLKFDVDNAVANSRLTVFTSRVFGEFVPALK